MVINVLIVDDHTLVRRGLREILAAEADIAQVGQARDGAEGLALLRAKSWNVVVLDISMAGMNGIEVLTQIKIEQPNTPVIMLSMYEDVFVVRKCIELGASGYVTKDAAPEELVAAIRTVLTGGNYVSNQIDAAMRASDTLPAGSEGDFG